MLWSVALLSGCATQHGDFCEIASPIYFDRPDVVTWLTENDAEMLRDVVVHNEMVDRCR